MLPFLKREHLLNRLLGRYTWQRLQTAHKAIVRNNCLGEATCPVAGRVPAVR
jgi:hypothetical protein